MRWTKRPERVDYSKRQPGYGTGLPAHRPNQLPSHTPAAAISAHGDDDARPPHRQFLIDIWRAAAEPD